MNGFIGSLLYDSLNKLVIGFLILLPFILLYLFHEHTNPSYLSATLIAVACWMLGLYFWGVVKVINVYSNTAEHKCGKLTPLFSSASGSNNLHLINYSYKRIFGQYHISFSQALVNEGVLTRKDYLLLYYSVQSNGLLGNVPQLECFSAFFKIFSRILIYWFILFPWMIIFIIYGRGLNSEHIFQLNTIGWLMTIIFYWFGFPLLFLLTVVCRRATELSIHSAVIEASLFLSLPNPLKK